jgi:hypothetical protein
MSATATRDEWETVTREARARGVDALDIERERLQERQAQYWTAIKRANALVDAGGHWVYSPGSLVPVWVAPSAPAAAAQSPADTTGSTSFVPAYAGRSISPPASRRVRGG